MKKQPEDEKPPPEPKATEETPFEKFERLAKKVIGVPEREGAPQINGRILI